MTTKALNVLLLDECQEVYDAKHQITRALPKVMGAASSADLKQAIQLHLERTERKIVRLEQTFEITRREAKRRLYSAMKGLIAQGENTIKVHDASVTLDAGLVGSAQRVEHSQVAFYGTGRAYAEALSHKEMAGLLHEIA